MTAEYITRVRPNELPAFQPIRVNHNTKQISLALGVLVLILLLAAPFVCAASDMPVESLLYPASLLFTILFASQVWSWYRISGSLFDPYIIFLSAAMLFNGSRAVLEVFQVNRNGILGPIFSPETTLKTLYLVTLGLWCFHIGGTIGCSTKRELKLKARTLRITNHDGLRTVGWFLIAVAIVPSFVLLKEAVTAVLSYGYLTALFQKDAATSVNATPQLLAFFLVPGAILVAAASKERRIQLGLTAALIGVYAMTHLFLGSRSVAVAAIVPYLWLWHRCIRPVPKVVMISAICAFLIIAPLIGVSRSLTGSDRLSPGVLLQALSSFDNPAVSIISEMGGSASTVAYTLQLVPDVRPFDYGASYAFAAFSLMPNLFWDVHPAVVHGTPCTWLVATVDPWISSRGGGMGYSFLAEAYLNAGWFGVVVIPAIMGFLLAKLTVWVSNPSELAKLACAATILVFSVKYARSDANEIFRGIVWYAIGPYALVCALTAKVYRRR